MKFGSRNLLLISIAGFVVSSALCGQAHSLVEMIIFRIFQGAFGASVIPLAQSIMVKIYPPEERGKAMALFSVGILLGPILGPTVGGIITQHMDWRWIFYVNLPIGVLCLALLHFFVHIDDREKEKNDIDISLVAAMAIGIGLLQMVLEQGNEKGWFSSHFILFSTIISVLAWIFFITRSFQTRGPIAPIWLMKDRNLTVSCLIMGLFSMGLFGITQLQPMMLERLLNYPVQTTGFLMAPRGLTSAIVLVCIAQFMDRLDARKVIAVGLLLTGGGTYLMTLYSLNIDPYWILMPSIIQGAGMGLVFAPLSQLAYNTLAPKDTVGGAVMFNLWRTIGGSFGVSIVNTYYSRVQQEQWHSLGGAITQMNPQVQQMAAAQHTSMTDPHFIANITMMLHQQSSMVAFVHTFGFIMISFLVLLPLILLFKLKKKGQQPIPAG